MWIVYFLVGSVFLLFLMSLLPAPPERRLISSSRTGIAGNSTDIKGTAMEAFYSRGLHDLPTTGGARHRTEGTRDGSARRSS